MTFLGNKTCPVYVYDLIIYFKTAEDDNRDIKWV